MSALICSEAIVRRLKHGVIHIPDQRGRVSLIVYWYSTSPCCLVSHAATTARNIDSPPTKRLVLTNHFISWALRRTLVIKGRAWLVSRGKITYRTSRVIYNQNESDKYTRHKKWTFIPGVNTNRSGESIAYMKPSGRGFWFFPCKSIEAKNSKQYLIKVAFDCPWK